MNKLSTRLNINNDFGNNENQPSFNIDFLHQEILVSLNEMNEMKKDPSKMKTYDNMDEFWEAVHK